MLAYTVQPPVVFLYMMAKLIFRASAALLLILWGQRGLSFKPLIHPWAADNNDVWWHARGKGTIFTMKNDGTERGDIQLFLFFLTPLIHVTIVVAAYVATFFSKVPWSFWQMVAVAEGVVVGLVVLLCLLVVILWLHDKIGDTVREVAPKGLALAVVGFLALLLILLAIRHPMIAGMIVATVAVSWLASWVATMDKRELEKLPQEERQNVLLEREYSRYQAIACNGPMVAKYSALPQERRTVYLFYRDLKAKVCKQYAV